LESVGGTPHLDTTRSTGNDTITGGTGGNESSNVTCRSSGSDGDGKVAGRVYPGDVGLYSFDFKV
jgi:hypothetical protein